MALVLSGKVVTFDDEVGVLDDASVYVADTETGRNAPIEAVVPAGGAGPAGYEQAPRIRTEGVIYPGLIDLHNHLAYNYRSLWFAPRVEPYTSRGPMGRPQPEQHALIVVCGSRPSRRLCAVLGLGAPCWRRDSPRCRSRWGHL